jgi:hypothetical protein
MVRSPHRIGMPAAWPLPGIMHRAGAWSLAAVREWDLS